MGHAEGFMQGRVISMDEALSRVGKHLEEAARITEETAKRQESMTAQRSSRRGRSPYGAGSSPIPTRTRSWSRS